MSLAQFNDDLDRFLVDFGEPIQVNGSEIFIVFDEFSDPMDLNAEGREITAMGKTSDLSTLNHQDTIEIRGTTYKVVQIDLIDEGNFTKLKLQK